MNALTIPKLPCQIVGLGCFGCCGRYFEKEDAVRRSIHKNTLALKEWVGSAKDFCWRQKSLHPSGVCSNVVSKNKGCQEQFFCGVHPQLSNKKEDVRKNYCNTKFLCKLAQQYQDMSIYEQEELIAFLETKKSKGLDSFEYSMLNANDLLYEEFNSLMK